MPRRHVLTRFARTNTQAKIRRHSEYALTYSECAPVLATLFDEFPAPPAPAPPPRKKLRERRHECGHFIRKVKGEKCQVRWWLAGYGSINCGLYDEWTAGEVRRKLSAETARHPPTPLGLWRALVRVLTALRAAHWAGLPDADPLPRYVKALAEGAGFCAKVKKGGRVLECPGPYKDAEAAHLAMCAVLAREFPPRVRAVRPAPVTLADYLAGWDCAV